MSEANKPGIETTEAWGGLAGVLSSLTALFTTTNTEVQVVAVLAVAAIVCVFIWSRTKCKCGQTP